MTYHNVYVRLDPLHVTACVSESVVLTAADSHHIGSKPFSPTCCSTLANASRKSRHCTSGWVPCAAPFLQRWGPTTSPEPQLPQAIQSRYLAIPQCRCPSYTAGALPMRLVVRAPATALSRPAHRPCCGPSLVYFGSTARRGRRALARDVPADDAENRCPHSNSSIYCRRGFSIERSTSSTSIPSRAHPWAWRSEQLSP
jgi:hypothetical protein